MMPWPLVTSQAQESPGPWDSWHVTMHDECWPPETPGAHPCPPCPGALASPGPSPGPRPPPPPLLGQSPSSARTQRWDDNNDQCQAPVIMNCLWHLSACEVSWHHDRSGNSLVTSVIRNQAEEINWCCDDIRCLSPLHNHSWHKPIITKWEFEPVFLFNRLMCFM